MENRTFGLEVKALHIQQPPIARFHQNRNPTLLGLFPQEDFDHQTIALIDHEVGSTDKVVDVLFGDAVGKQNQASERILLKNLARRPMW